MAVRKTKHREEPASYYDTIYRRAGGYPTARYDRIYSAVLSLLKDSRHHSILEVGCGIGVLGQIIAMSGFRKYYGFDFSRVAIESCSPDIRENVWVGDAYDRANFDKVEYNTIVCVETFEHIDDLKVIRENIDSGKRVVFSVPDFDSRSHLRMYPDEDSIRRYYEGLLDVSRVIQIRTQKEKSIFVCDSYRG